jgi:hypothetical protein
VLEAYGTHGMPQGWSALLVLVVGALTLGAVPAAVADVSNPTGTTFDAVAGEAFSGRVASFSSSFQDIDNFRAEIDWGDGSPSSAGSITSCLDCPNYGYYVDGSHTYQDAGSYSTTITIISLRDAERATAVGRAK